MDAVGYLQSPIGRIRFVLEKDRQLVRIDLNVPPPSEVQNPSFFEDFCVQFSEYFAGTRKNFTLPFCLNGSAFEMRVWKVLLQIPYGETRSYGEIAAACGNRKAARAVGQALHRNPLPIIIPCHRVVNSKGELAGEYAFGGAWKQAQILQSEGVEIVENRVNLEKYRFRKNT